MENLKLYTYDCAWMGAVVCVAKSKEEAIEKFKNTDAYYIDGSFAMIIELFCDVNTSDKDVKIILDKCKKTFQEKINSKIEYWQKALNMLENKK